MFTERGTDTNPLVVKPEPYEKPEVLVNWAAPSRIFKNRQPVWFIGVLILSAIVVALLALAGQWTLLLAIASFTVVLITINIVEPSGQRYEINTYGIRINEKFTHYRDLKWFWFETEQEQTALYIATYLKFPYVFEIPLPADDGEKMKDTIQQELLKYLPYHQEGQRDWLNTIDNVVSRIEGWVPQSLINGYTKVFHRK